MAKSKKMDDLLDEDQPLTGELPAEEEPAIPEVSPTAKPPEEEKAPPKAPTTTIPQGSGPTKKPVPDRRALRIKTHEKLYASLDLSPRYIPPITRKRSAIYQLYEYKSKRDNRLVGIDAIVDPYPIELVPTYTFTDLDEQDLTKREKTMTYWDGTESKTIEDPLTGQSRIVSVPKPGTPRIIGGQVVVNIFSKYNWFVWWELHPRNASNKWRDKSQTPLFERIDTKHEGAHVQNILHNMKFEAERYVLGISHDKRINLASALTNPTINTKDVNPQDLLLTLRLRARNNPEEILFTAPDNMATIKVSIVHALDLGILTFLDETECYYFADESVPFFRVLVNNDPLESLAEFLSSEEGKSDLEAIQGMLQFWF